MTLGQWLADRGRRPVKHSRPSPPSAHNVTQMASTSTFSTTQTPRSIRTSLLPSTVVEIFQIVRPSGATPTGQRLNKLLKSYLQRYQPSPDTTKPINIIVITDGEPSDDVESPIIQAAKKLDKLDAPAWQVGIQFFQVGKEPGAREHLRTLDDGLRELAGDEELRDIVDTVPFSGDSNARLEKRSCL
jgi:hypothetical protein